MDAEVELPGCRRCGSPMTWRSIPRHSIKPLAELIFCHYDCGECSGRFRLVRWAKPDRAGDRERRWNLEAR
jgi:hypothetical protein